MALTNIEIRNAKGREKPYKLSDGGWLYLVVNSSGSKLWRMAYRFADKEKLLSLGPYPQVSLKDARKQRDQAKAALALGVDPGEQKRLAKLVGEMASATTFKMLAAEYSEKLRREDRASNTVEKKEWQLSLVMARLGARPIGQITSAEVLAALRPIEARGKLETVNRLRGTIGAVFRYAIATARAENDPTIALKGALVSAKSKHRAAITDPAELGGFLRALDGYDGQGTTLAALRLLPLVFTRPGELRLAEGAEFDLDKAVWTIPASRTKMRREHQVPLSRQALAILSDLKTITGTRRLAFLGLRSADRPISENTIADSDEAGHAFQYEAGHLFRSEAGQRSDLKPATCSLPPQVRIDDVALLLIGQERMDFGWTSASCAGSRRPNRSDRHCG